MTVWEVKVALRVALWIQVLEKFVLKSVGLVKGGQSQSNEHAVVTSSNANERDANQA